MSDKDVMQKALEDSASKYAPDPIPNRGPAMQEATRGPYEVAPHMRSYAGGNDTTPAERARQAEQDRNLSSVPPARKP
jgi:hypothetical protein